MFSRKSRFPRSADCEHPNSDTVRNSGIERNVCKSCGRVSFSASDGLTGTVDRSQFEREIERTHQPIG